MSRVDDLKVEYELAVKVAALEEELAGLKAADQCDACGRRAPHSTENPRLRVVKDELRELRCVLRLGRPAPDGSHNGFDIIDGKLVEKEAE